MEATAKKVMAARAALVLDQPFFGMLALRLKVVADPSCKTAWVDGVTLGYNPAFVESLSPSKLKALLAHEVMHCACGHPWRRGNREPKQWNGACDHAINPILVGANFDLPEGALLDPANEGKAAEWIYDRMPQPQEGDDGEEQGEPEQGDDGGEQGSGAGEPGDEQGDDDAQGSGSGDDDGEEGDESGEPGEGDGEGQDDTPGDEQGEVRDAPANATQEGATEAEWATAVQQAANAADAAGKLPGALERFTTDAAKPKVDWRSALRRFVQEVTNADYSWTRPNRRFLPRGLYMPALHSEAMGPMVIAIDTSGSVDDVLLAQFNAEVQAIVDESDPERVHVIYCDAKVQRTDTFERDDLLDFDSLDPVGGGGTDFSPVFAAVEELDEAPACVVYLTDLAGRFPTEAPDVPTLWATTVERATPFGEVLPIN